MTSDLPFPKRSGKVRDVYEVSDVVGSPTLLIIATDRISAFDCILPSGVPGKGKLLTRLSQFWFDRVAAIVDHHLITTRLDELPARLRKYSDQIEGRFMLGRKTQVVPIECVARGYLAGSGWKEYQRSGSVCGVALPGGLRLCEKLPEPIFTPATKADAGHDENVSFAFVADRIGDDLAGRLRDLTLRIYTDAAEYAATRGILIADTKFEFGHDVTTGKLLLIDEILTPDSSRFWPAATYTPGKEQASFDKQFVRDWLEKQAWNKKPPAPRLPEEVVEGTLDRYKAAYLALSASDQDGQTPR